MWEQFKTEFDKMPTNVARRAADYNRGFETGSKATKFYIARNGVWSADNVDGSTTFSYECLGYHANTAYFFRGVLDSGVEIVDYRQAEQE